MKQSEAAQGLKALRERAGLTVREVAAALDRPPSSYAFYEDAYKKPHLPIWLVNALIPLFEEKGVPRIWLYKLAGIEDPDALAALERYGETGLDNDLLPHIPRDDNERDMLESLKSFVLGQQSGAEFWTVRTDALNLAGVMHSDIALVEPGADPEPDDLVLAELREDGTASNLLRLFKPPHLIAHSTQMTWLEPEYIDQRRVVVKGVVRLLFRRTGAAGPGHGGNDREIEPQIMAVR